MVYNKNQSLPESNNRLLNLIIDINRNHPPLELRENQFNDDVQC